MRLNPKRTSTNTYSIFTNYTCNLNCSYCFEKNKLQLVNDKAHVIDYIKYAYKTDWEKYHSLDQVVKIHLIGGEPFLVPDLIECICDTAIEEQVKYNLHNNFKVYISSNGTLLSTPEIRKLLIKYKNFIRIGISIDGLKEEHDKYRIDYNGNGSYDKVVDGIKAALDIFDLSKDSTKVTCKSTYSHADIHNWSDGVISLLNLGIRWVNANYVTEEIWTEEESEMIADQFFNVTDYLFENDLFHKVNVMQCNKYPLQSMVNYDVTKLTNLGCSLCRTPKAGHCLGFDGKVYRCHRFITENDDKYCMGVLEGTDLKITNPELVEKMNCIYDNLPEKCLKCDISKECFRCTEYLFSQNYDNPIKFLKESTPPLCGWVTAEVASRYYFKRRLRAQLGIPEDAPNNIKLVKKKREVNSNSFNS